MNTNCHPCTPSHSRRTRHINAACNCVWDGLERRTMFAVGFDPYTFNPVDVEHGFRAPVIADFNKDNKLDVVTTNDNGGMSTLLGNGNGTFQAPLNRSIVSNIVSMATADLNGDGKLDLAGVDLNSRNVIMLLGNGNGTFSQPYLIERGDDGGKTLTLADVNGDGKLDFIVSCPTSDRIAIIRGNGLGNFDVPTLYAAGDSPEASVVADINSDGRADIIVAASGARAICVLTQNANGTFAPPVSVGVSGSPAGIVTGDFNADGKKDIATNNRFDSNVCVLLGNGNGTFQSAVQYPLSQYGEFMIAKDMDNDGRVDLVVSEFTSQTVCILTGNVNGTFNIPQQFAVARTSNNLAAGDLNGDGRMDIVTAHGPTDRGLSILLASNRPTITRVNPAVLVNEGVTATNLGTFGGATGNASITLTASIGTITRNNSVGTWGWSCPATDDLAATTVTITATAPGGQSSSTTFSFQVKNVAPTINAFTVPTSGNEGGPFNLSAAASDPGGANDPLTYNWTLLRNGVSYQTYTGQTPTIPMLNNGEYRLDLAVTDGDGGQAIRSSAPFTLANVAPIISSTTIPAAASEGTPITFSAQVTDAGGDFISYRWRFTQQWIGSYPLTGESVTITVPEQGPLTVELVVDDGDGGIVELTRIVDVQNVAPTISTFTVPATANEGTTASLAAAATDPAASYDDLRYDWTITRPDGTTQVIDNTNGQINCDLPDNGVYIAAVVVRDDDGGSSTRSQTITVVNRAPTASFSINSNLVLAGNTVTDGFVLGATDPSSVDQAAGFMYRISWGDGSLIQTIARTPGNGGLLVHHLYSTPGVYPVSVMAFDKDGLAGTTTATVVVSTVTGSFAPNAPQPTVNIKFPVDINPNSLRAGDLRVTNTSGGPSPYMPNDSVVSYDAATRTATWTITRPLADGNYHVWLPASVARASAGWPIPQEVNFDFFTLAGDANRDRAVNFDDLLIVAQNYGQSGRLPSQGNVNHDAAGTVDFDDLLMIAQQYGKGMPALFTNTTPITATGSRSAELPRLLHRFNEFADSSTVII